MSGSTRRIEFDVEAIALTAICIFLWLSLLSYDPADSLGDLPRPLDGWVAVDNAVYPINAQIQNVCGWFGALTATVLIQALGIGSLLVAAGLTALSVWLFRVQTNYVPPSRQIGWVLVIVGSITLLALLPIHPPYSPMISPAAISGPRPALGWPNTCNLGRTDSDTSPCWWRDFAQHRLFVAAGGGSAG